MSASHVIVNPRGDCSYKKRLLLISENTVFKNNRTNVQHVSHDLNRISEVNLSEQKF